MEYWNRNPVNRCMPCRAYATPRFTCLLWTHLLTSGSIMQEASKECGIFEPFCFFLQPLMWCQWGELQLSLFFAKIFFPVNGSTGSHLPAPAAKGTEIKDVSWERKSNLRMNKQRGWQGSAVSVPWERSDETRGAASLQTRGLIWGVNWG